MSQWIYVTHNITIYRAYSKGKRMVSYGGKSVHETCACVGSWVGVPAMQMK